MDNKIFINYGKDPSAMTYDLMCRAKVNTNLKNDMKVILKPNLVVPKEAKYGATTHPEIVDGIIKYLLKNNITDITIAEGSWVGVKKTADAFKKCGYESLKKKYDGCNIKFLDTKEDEVIYVKHDDEKLGVCRTIYEADYLINIPVLKGHCQTKLTCCLKNMKGCIPDSEKRRYHTMGLTKPIALLSCVLKPDLHIVDSICGDLDFEEGGNPVQSDRIILGTDPVLIDSYCAALLGYENRDIGYLNHANNYGVGNFINDDTQIIELNKESKPIHVKSSGRALKLGEKIDDKNACSACYANLIFALDKVNYNNNEKIRIGQGYRGVISKGIGIGNCTRGFDENLKGCPPSAVEIVNFLNSNVKHKN